MQLSWALRPTQVWSEELKRGDGLKLLREAWEGRLAAQIPTWLITST